MDPAEKPTRGRGRPAGNHSSIVPDSVPFDAPDAPHELLTEWIAETGLSSSGGFKTYLYQITGPDQRAFVKSFEDFIPTLDEIAALVGPGRFLLMVRGARGGMKSVNIRISDLYKGRENAVLPLQQYAAAQSPMQGIEQALGIVERLFERIVQPVMKQGADLRTHESSAAGSPAIGAGTDALSKMMQQVNDFALSTAKQSIMQANEIRSMAAAIPTAAQYEDEDDEDEGQEQMSVVDRVIPLIEQFLPVLLGNATTAAAFAPIVRAAPDFVELTKDKEALHDVARYVAVKFGRAALGDMVSRLGLPSMLVDAVTDNTPTDS